MRTARSETRSRLSWSLVALGLYFIITLFVTYPIPAHMSTRIIGEEYRDAYAYVWTLWWAKEALLDPGKRLVELSLMNHPKGLLHPFMLSMAGVYLPALPFAVLFSPAATYNIQVLLSLVLSGLTMYWLCVELTGEPRASLVGGLVYCIFPNKMGHVLGGHLPQVSVHWFPLYALLFHRAIRRPGWKTAFPTILTLGIASVIHVMHLAYIVLPLTLVLIYLSWRDLGKALFAWNRIVVAVVIFSCAFLISSPFLLPTVFLSLRGDTYLLESGTVEHATDLLAFFTPSPYHPVLESAGRVLPFVEEVFPNRRSLREELAYPGIIATGLALWAILRGKKGETVWGTLAVIAAILSLGPLLKAGGELVTYQVDNHQSYIVLPYAFVKALPMLDIGRTPGRLNATTMFAVSILAAYGAAYALSHLAHRPGWAWFLLGLMILGISFEYLVAWPFPTGTAEIPPSIQKIAGEQDDGALLHIPMIRRRVNHRALYYQTFLPRPIVAGRIHRVVPETVPWSETILGLAEPDLSPGDIVPRPDLMERLSWLRHFDVDYVLFHYLTYEKMAPDADAHYRDFLNTLLGPPRYEDQYIAAFRVPEDVPAVPSSSLLYTLSSNGWLAPEQDGDMWRRWLGEEGELYIYTTQPMTGNLQFTVDSHLNFPVLEVYLNGQTLDSFIVEDRITHTTRSFTLGRGMSVVRFSSPSGCTTLVDNPVCWSDTLLSPPGGNRSPLCDPQAIPLTCRSFVFDRIGFIPADARPADTAVDVNFGNRLLLRGWHVSGEAVRPGETLTVTLTWQALTALDERYVVFVHLLSSDGSLIAQDDTPPVGRRLPSWPLGTVFGYPVALTLPAEVPPGEYRLLVGVYMWPDLERLAVLTDVPGSESGAVEIGRVQMLR